MRLLTPNSFGLLVHGDPDRPGPYPHRRRRAATRVGITSYRRPDQKGIDKTEAAVNRRMTEFRRRLAALPGVSAVVVRKGRGRWATGSEPSWVVAYRGNGQARRLMAEYGDRHIQDAVLMMYDVPPEKATDTLTDLHLGAVPAVVREALDSALAAVGKGGWTWYKQGRGFVLRVASVRSWEGEQSQAHHTEIIEGIRGVLERNGIQFHLFERGIRTETIGQPGKGHDTDYKAVL